jgi:hypothetical protein
MGTADHGKQRQDVVQADHGDFFLTNKLKGVADLVLSNLLSNYHLSPATVSNSILVLSKGLLGLGSLKLSRRHLLYALLYESNILEKHILAVLANLPGMKTNTVVHKIPFRRQVENRRAEVLGSDAIFEIEADVFGVRGRDCTWNDRGTWLLWPGRAGIKARKVGTEELGA